MVFSFITLAERAGAAFVVAVLCVHVALADEPPALNPFGPRPTARPDAEPGRVELSDGKVHDGSIYLTRDVRLKVYDSKLKRQREIPLRVVRRIDCKVKREGMEDEWRFKELAADTKFRTGRTYPAREYLHTITLRDGRTIAGPLSAIVYVEPDESPAAAAAYQPTVKPLRFVLHKRDKGKIGTDLKSLVYVRRIVLGEDAKKKPSEPEGTKSKHKPH